MKRIITLTFLLAITGFVSHAQNHEIIEASQVKINGLAIAFTSKASIINKFGQPDSTTTNYRELNDKTWEVLIYSGGRFSFDNDELIRFEISGSNFQWEYSGTIIKPGDNVSVLSSPFPRAYNRNKRNNNGATLIWGSYHNGILEASSAWILISNNSSTGLIEKIELCAY